FRAAQDAESLPPFTLGEAQRLFFHPQADPPCCRSLHLHLMMDSKIAARIPVAHLSTEVAGHEPKFGGVRAAAKPREHPHDADAWRVARTAVEVRLRDLDLQPEHRHRHGCPLMHLTLVAAART